MGNWAAESQVHLSYWLPSNTQEGEKVPVIAVVSPYYSFGQPGSESGATDVVGAGRGEFIYDNFIPHGYAFAQVSVFGTELSSGCFDYRGAEKVLGFMKRSSGLASKIGLTATWACMENRMRAPHNGRQRQLEASISRQ